MAFQPVRGKCWQLVGRVAFWLSWPLLWWYLRKGWRTRLVVVANGQLLLVKSWLGNDQWGLPGGGLHSREEPVTGALRELYEETHLKLKPQQLKYLYKDRASHYGLHFRYHCFAVNLAKTLPVSRQKYEITQLKWVGLDQALNMRITNDTRQAIAAWTKRQRLLK